MKKSSNGSRISIPDLSRRARAQLQVGFNLAWVFPSIPLLEHLKVQAQVPKQELLVEALATVEEGADPLKEIEGRVSFHE